MMTLSLVTEEMFRAAIAKEPSKWSLRLPFADWLAERGRIVEANGQRWQVKKKKDPLRANGWHGGSVGDRYRWWKNNAQRIEARHRLSSRILNVLLGWQQVNDLDSDYVGFADVAGAEYSLAHALHALGIDA